MKNVWKNEDIGMVLTATQGEVKRNLERMIQNDDSVLFWYKQRCGTERIKSIYQNILGSLKYLKFNLPLYLKKEKL